MPPIPVLKGFLTILSAISAFVVHGQVPPETKQFGFWVGSWNATGKSLADPGKWKQTKATNRISRIMNGFTVLEEFRMGKTRGSSWSVYDSTRKMWHQTWVDNEGSYIALNGRFENGKMVLSTSPSPDRPLGINRMTYHKIMPKAFDWEWEGSRDGGKTWKLLWHLHYTRK